MNLNILLKLSDTDFFNNENKISEFLRKLCVYLSFDKKDEIKVNEYLKQIDENEELKKKESIQKWDLVIFFLTNNFIANDQFKEDCRKRGNKVFLIVSLENIQSSFFDLNEFILDESISSAESIKRNKILLSRLLNLKN